MHTNSSLNLDTSSNFQSSQATPVSRKFLNQQPEFICPYRPYFADHNGCSRMDTGNNQRQIRTGRSGKSAANITIHPLEGWRSDRMRQADYLITANP